MILPAVNGGPLRREGWAALKPPGRTLGSPAGHTQLFGTVAIWSSKSQSSGRTQRESVLQGQTGSPSTSRGLGNHCPLGAQAVTWPQSWWSVPHDCSLNVTRHLLSDGTAGDTRAERAQGRAGGAEPSPEPQVPPLAHKGLQGSLWQPCEREGRCFSSEGFQLWDLGEAWSDPGRLSSLCSLKKKKKERKISFSDTCPIALLRRAWTSLICSGEKFRDQYFKSLCP